MADKEPSLLEFPPEGGDDGNRESEALRYGFGSQARFLGDDPEKTFHPRGAFPQAHVTRQLLEERG